MRTNSRYPWFTYAFRVAKVSTIMFVFQALVTLNLQVALFRDLMLDVGGSKDGPALREKVRRVGMATAEAVIRTNNINKTSWG